MLDPAVLHASDIVATRDANVFVSSSHTEDPKQPEPSSHDTEEQSCTKMRDPPPQVPDESLPPTAARQTSKRITRQAAGKLQRKGR
jgi:hypothetical protein